MPSVRNIVSFYESLADSGSKGNVHSSQVPKVVDECPAEFQTTKDTQRSGVHKSPPAWVSCDDCHKWRCIPSYLADIVKRPNFKWTCKDNEDKAFADCSIQQVMTDVEIDTQLKLYASNDVQDFACIIEDSEPISWAEIQDNLFLHRNRKTEKIDEIMVCTCMPPINGSLGCGDQCLNRMLNIECVRDTCPCGDRCSNQQFQKHKYAKLELSSCGKKGAGLQLLENVLKGQFLMEYVGEVLDQTAYEARQRSYASMGHKHFYFMMLDGGEVIDACSKGNLSRFMNHSCDPNCRSEKWMVNGEICVGLFAIRDIMKGEEVTFNYQYVPVSGAAVKKCFCGAANCRGYIGSNSSDAGAMVRGDSDEDPKQVMILPELEKDTSCRFSSDALPLGALTQTMGHIQSESTMSSLVSVFNTSSHSSDKTEAEETMCRPGSDAQPLDLMKSSSTSFSMKKAKGISQSDITEINKQTSISTQQIERIEKKLKKVSDGRGGIGNHKHATVYLKLLSVITAEGDHLRGIQRARGLSFMLDALLKTKPHSVLVYIISKNGLQMLHNVMKQNSNDFMRTPIIRKLLKVLEFLAVQGILTQERIRNCPYAGTESFEKSMTALTRHPDMQVRNIARKLQVELKLHSDKNSVRKVHPSQQNATSVTLTSTCSTNERRIHEPESQWVQPSYVTTKDPPSSAKGTEADLKFQKSAFSNAEDEAPPRFQPLCENTHLQNPRTDLDGAVTRKRPVHESDFYNCTTPQPAGQGPGGRDFHAQRRGYDKFGRFWPPWPEEEKGPLKERRRQNSEEEKWLVKDGRPREENSRHEDDNWRKRLRQEESKCYNWRREKENWRKWSPQDNRPRAEHEWLKRPRGEERSREDHKRLKRPRGEESSREDRLKRLRGDEWSREEEKLRKEKENWRRRPQEMEMSREEDDRRKKQPEKEKWRKCTREENLQWEEREHWAREEDDRRKKQPEKEKWREEREHWRRN